MEDLLGLSLLDSSLCTLLVSLSQAYKTWLMDQLGAGGQWHLEVLLG